MEKDLIMKKLLIINGSPRGDGMCDKIIKALSPGFLECHINQYDTYKLAPAPCTDCRYCEMYEGCSNKDLDVFFMDFEEADYIIFVTPIYNNFFPAPLKAIIDRFQHYYSARFKRGAKPPIKKEKSVGVAITSGSFARNSAEYMVNTLKQSFTVLNGEINAFLYVPGTDTEVESDSLADYKIRTFVRSMKNQGQS